MNKGEPLENKDFKETDGVKDEKADLPDAVEFLTNGSVDVGSDADAEDILTVRVYDESAAKKRFSTVGFGFAMFTLVVFAVCQMLATVAAVADAFSGTQISSSNLFLNALTPTAIYLFGLPALILFFYFFRVDGETPQRKNISVGTWLLLFVISFGLMYIGSYTGQFTMWGLSSIVGYDYNNMLNSMIDYDGMWVTVLFLCIVAPFGEEFIFRKLLIDRTHKYGGTVSIFLSALMFGLMHANFYQFFYAFLLGLLLGYVYYSTGKLRYSVALHVAINFVGSVVTSYLQLGLENLENAGGVADPGNVSEWLSFLAEHAWVIISANAFTVFVFLAMPCAIIFPIVLRKRIVLERGEIAIPRKRSFEVAFGSVGVIVMLAVYAVQFLQNIILPPLAEYLVRMAQ